MKIALIDDDSSCLEQMEQICRDYCVRHQLEPEISRFSSGEAFLEKAGETQWHLVFLDIFMNGKSGIETARELRRTSPETRLVFLTSSEDFMPEAFSVHAYEYVVKPFDARRIEQILEETRTSVCGAEPSVSIPYNRKPVRLFLNDIVSVVSDAHYLDITLIDQSVMRIRMTVPAFLKLVQEDSRFLLVNRGVLLNAEHISDMDESRCLLDNGRSYPLQVRNRKQIREMLWEYNFQKIRNSR